MTEIIYMKKSEYEKMTAEKLRKKYLKKTPEGYSKSEIKSMSDEDILDMDYFLNEGTPTTYSTKEPAVIYHLIDDDPPDNFDDEDMFF